ncbi:MAG: hypothetical protein IJI84_00485 [Clostridia bacterium]|nr:hypothetical protein [Clostridia bacterium]
MVDKKSYLYLAATAVTSAIIASMITFFITRHVSNKKENINNNPISIKKMDTINDTITTEQKKITSKTTDDIDIQPKKQPTDQKNENIKNFNKTLLDLQDLSFDETHEKNSEAIFKHINNSNTLDPNSKVTHKTNGTPFQNILVEDYYEIEANKVRTVFLPIKTSRFDNFCHSVVNKLNEKIDGLSELDYGNEIKKEDAAIVKDAIDAYCLNCNIKTIISKSLELNNNGEEIAGFLISEYILKNNTKSYKNSVATFQ